MRNHMGRSCSSCLDMLLAGRPVPGAFAGPGGRHPPGPRNSASSHHLPHRRIVTARPNRTTLLLYRPGTEPRDAPHAAPSAAHRRLMFAALGAAGLIWASDAFLPRRFGDLNAFPPEALKLLQRAAIVDARGDVPDAAISLYEQAARAAFEGGMPGHSEGMVGLFVREAELLEGMGRPLDGAKVLQRALGALEAGAIGPDALGKESKEDRERRWRRQFALGMQIIELFNSMEAPPAPDAVAIATFMKLTLADMWPSFREPGTRPEMQSIVQDYGKRRAALLQTVARMDAAPNAKDGAAAAAEASAPRVAGPNADGGPGSVAGDSSSAAPPADISQPAPSQAVPSQLAPSQAARQRPRLPFTPPNPPSWLTPLEVSLGQEAVGVLLIKLAAHIEAGNDAVPPALRHPLEEATARGSYGDGIYHLYAALTWADKHDRQAVCRRATIMCNLADGVYRQARRKAPLPDGSPPPLAKSMGPKATGYAADLRMARQWAESAKLLAESRPREPACAECLKAAGFNHAVILEAQGWYAQAATELKELVAAAGKAGDGELQKRAEEVLREVEDKAREAKGRRAAEVDGPETSA